LPGWPVPLEAGAEFVHGRPPLLSALARGAKEIRGGQYLRGPRKAGGLFGSVLAKVGSLPSRRERSVAEAFGTQSWRRRTRAEGRELAESYIEGFNAARLEKTSLRWIEQQARAADRVEGDRIFRLPLGYDRVAGRLARGLRIEMGVTVRAVRWRRGR